MKKMKEMKELKATPGGIDMFRYLAETFKTSTFVIIDRCAASITLPEGEP